MVFYQSKNYLKYKVDLHDGIKSNSKFYKIKENQAKMDKVHNYE